MIVRAIRPVQEWPPFEQAFRDLAKFHLKRIQAREAGGEQQPTEAVARLQGRADAMSQFGMMLKTSRRHGWTSLSKPQRSAETSAGRPCDRTLPQCAALKGKRLMYRQLDQAGFPPSDETLYPLAQESSATRRSQAG
jgi:hypothetical protein